MPESLDMSVDCRVRCSLTESLRLVCNLCEGCEPAASRGHLGLPGCSEDATGFPIRGLSFVTGFLCLESDVSKLVDCGSVADRAPRPSPIHRSGHVGRSSRTPNRPLLTRMGLREGGPAARLGASVLSVTDLMQNSCACEGVGRVSTLLTHQSRAETICAHAQAGLAS